MTIEEENADLKHRVNKLTDLLELTQKRCHALSQQTVDFLKMESAVYQIATLNTAFQLTTDPQRKLEVSKSIDEVIKEFWK